MKRGVFMFQNLIRWFYHTFLKKDYVSFKITSTCTVIIKSYFLLTTMQTAKIRALIKETGYKRRDEQQALIIYIALFLMKKKVLNSPKSSVTSQYIPDLSKGKERLLIDIQDIA